MMPRWPLAWMLVLACPTLAAQEDSLASHLALLGDDVKLESIEGPVIHQPARWVAGQTGDYVYRFTAGSDGGELDQVERHQPDPARPAQAWTRHIGENVIEHVDIVDPHAIRIYTETDRRHGYRVEFQPGIRFQPGLAPGDTWQSDSRLEVYPLDDSKTPDYTGRMTATHHYLGAWRITVPAGRFDAVLIHDDYELQVGPLKATDERYAFYARDVGLVAEVEGVRASALIVFRTSEESAKVLVSYPQQDAGQ